jgi:hypothetical protein
MFKPDGVNQEGSRQAFQTSGHSSHKNQPYIAQGKDRFFWRVTTFIMGIGFLTMVEANGLQRPRKSKSP